MRSEMMLDDDVVGDELAPVHDRLDARPISVPAATAARSMSPVESWMSPCLVAISLACVPLPAPGGPSSIRFVIASSPL